MTTTTAALREFIAARQEADISNAEINRELAVLRQAFNLAIQAGRLLTKPHFPMLKERNTRKGFLEREQINRISNALEATETADDGRKTAGELVNVVRFACATGWRRYVIVDEAMQQEAAARLDAFTAAPQRGKPTGMVSTFEPKIAKVTRPPQERSA